jgi:peptide/nickel transport system ATP-binding protein
MAGTGKFHLREDALLRAEDIVVEFPVGRSGAKVHAVSGVSIDVRRGETLGLVGESGCGKSTLGRAILQLPAPTSGSVVFDGVELTTKSQRAVRAARRRMQMIFQDPISSLNPRYRVGRIVSDPLDAWKEGTKEERRRRVHDVLEAVGLDPETSVDRRPHEFSGGQCQRISIARCLIVDPELIICDEPVSSLDVSVQAQIINLLEDLKDRFGLTMIFIAHDLSVVRNISDRVAVMYLGKLCEVAPSERLHRNPLHPYTDGLRRAIPIPDPSAAKADVELPGELPSPLNPPSGCRFRTRCPRAKEICAAEEPIMRALATDHYVACHFPNPATEPFEGPKAKKKPDRSAEPQARSWCPGQDGAER